MTRAGTEGGWRSLLADPWRGRALEAVRAISLALENPPVSDLLADKPHEQKIAEDATLARGRAGIALLFGFLAAAEPHLPPWDGPVPGRRRSAHHLDLALSHLGVAIDAIGSVTMPAALHTGFAGVAYAASILHELRGGAAGDDPNDDLDEALAEHVSQTPWVENVDLISGLVGFGAYGLSRLPRAAARRTVSSVVRRLRETATDRDGGIAWFTPPESLPPGTRADYAHGYYNVGVGHGQAGVIAFLGGAIGAGVETETAEPLLDGAVRWLFDQELPAGTISRFPYLVGPEIDPAPARAAWCYGDPGIAAALLYAARTSGSAPLAGEAIRIARASAARDPDTAGTIDACLCHGSAGLGHLLNRVHQASGDEAIGASAREWYRRAIESRRNGEGIAGFKIWKGALAEEGGWIIHPGLLDGAAGIALCLLAAATPVEPSWDHALLVAVPPLRGRRA